jgi:hypothetical protein
METSPTRPPGLYPDAANPEQQRPASSLNRTRRHPADEDPTDRRRLMLAFAALASPVLFSMFVVLDPAGLPREPAADFLGAVAADPSLYVAATALQIAAMICGVAGAAVVALAFRSTWPNLSATTAALMTIGSFGGMGFAGMKLTATSLTEDGRLLPGAVDTWKAVQDGAAFTILSIPLLMAILGALLLTVLLVRARNLVGWWPAPANLLGFVMSSGEFPDPVTAAGPLVQLIAIVAMVRLLIRVRGS